MIYLSFRIINPYFIQNLWIYINISIFSIGVNSSDICPPGALDDYFSDNGPRLRYLRLDGNEIKPPIPRELMMCFRLLRAIVI